jgi:hypothetical protein
MKQYLLKLYFTDLDETLNTRFSTHICIDIYAGNFEHAEVLAKRLEKVHGAERHEVLK